jgi:hypothetical protein
VILHSGNLFSCHGAVISHLGAVILRLGAVIPRLGVVIPHLGVVIPHLGVCFPRRGVLPASRTGIFRARLYLRLERPREAHPSTWKITGVSQKCLYPRSIIPLHSAATAAFSPLTQCTPRKLG